MKACIICQAQTANHMKEIPLCNEDCQKLLWRALPHDSKLEVSIGAESIVKNGTALVWTETEAELKEGRKFILNLETGAPTKEVSYNRHKLIDLRENVRLSVLKNRSMYHGKWLLKSFNLATHYHKHSLIPKDKQGTILLLTLNLGNNKPSKMMGLMGYYPSTKDYTTLVVSCIGSSKHINYTDINMLLLMLVIAEASIQDRQYVSIRSDDADAITNEDLREAGFELNEKKKWIKQISQIDANLESRVISNFLTEIETKQLEIYEDLPSGYVTIK